MFYWFICMYHCLHCYFIFFLTLKFFIPPFFIGNYQLTKVYLHIVIEGERFDIDVNYVNDWWHNTSLNVTVGHLHINMRLMNNTYRHEPEHCTMIEKKKMTIDNIIAYLGLIHDKCKCYLIINIKRWNDDHFIPMQQVVGIINDDDGDHSMGKKLCLIFKNYLIQ